jgi:putative membrane protein
MGFLIRALVNAVAIWLATEIVPGLHAGTRHGRRGGARLGLINAIVRPVLLVLTLPRPGPLGLFSSS